MTRNEFILKAFKESEAWYKASWVYSLFTVVKDSEVENIKHPYPYQIGVLNGKYVYYLSDAWVSITDSPPATRPLYLVEEHVLVNGEDDIVQKYQGGYPFKTRAGNLFVNYYCLVSAFKNKVDYINEMFSISKVENMIKDRIEDNVDPNNPDPQVISVAESKRFSSACASISGFANIATPSASRYTMLPPPGIKEYREQLLKKYEGKLNDPAIVAEIDKALVKYDREFQAKDPEGGFLYKDKAFNVSRKKLFLMHGYEQSDMSPNPDFIPRSLSEGWDIEKMPSMINSLRDGSFNRGAKTALGGEAVKFIFRIFATTRIAEEDCGTKIGMPRIVTKQDINKVLILSPTKEVILTEENIDQYAGQHHIVRSPGFCKTDNANFCLKCLGMNYRGSENALAALASEVGSDMLNIFMSKMHGSQLATTPWKWKETIS